jgi:hypothetical protein
MCYLCNMPSVGICCVVSLGNDQSRVFTWFHHKCACNSPRSLAWPKKPYRPSSEQLTCSATCLHSAHRDCEAGPSERFPWDPGWSENHWNFNRRTEMDPWQCTSGLQWNGKTTKGRYLLCRSMQSHVPHGRTRGPSSCSNRTDETQHHSHKQTSNASHTYKAWQTVPPQTRNAPSRSNRPLGFVQEATW